MQLVPYLDFDGDCAEAFAFYRDILGGEIVFRLTVGDSPMAQDFPASSHDRIMHIQLQSGAASLMGSDRQADCGVAPGAGCVNIMVDSAGEAERIWAGLADGADVRSALQPTFWSARFGVLTDRFGKSWMINCPPAD